MSTFVDFKSIIEEMRNPEHDEEIIHSYEKWAQFYEDIATYCQYEGPNAVASMLMAFLGDKQEARIVDLGAGTGLVGEILSKHGYCNLDALDPSRDMLDQAEKKGIYARLICDYLGPNKLDIPDAYYDAAVMCGTFIPNHANDSCFEEIIRILKPGAVFMFTINEKQLDIAEFKEFTARVQHFDERGIWKVLACERRKYTKLGDQEWDISLVYSVQKIK